uniref:C2H2-type domain-containing protein n=1 Tax=Eptatretus burgeri TaxID=7764 RepID=A0A8C4Q2H6_EPTBU
MVNIGVMLIKPLGDHTCSLMEGVGEGGRGGGGGPLLQPPCWDVICLINTWAIPLWKLLFGVPYLPRCFYFLVHYLYMFGEAAPTFMNGSAMHPHDSQTETNKRSFYKQDKPNNEMFAENNFHKAHKGKKGEHPCKCKTCGKSFNRLTNLNTHMTIHNGERPHKCTTCGKCFNRSSTLKRHMTIHNGERLYKCTSCGKSCNQSSNLKKHMRIHNGERPYKCTICGKSFNQSSNLKTHVTIHNGERPYKCTSCAKSFTQSSHLKSHMRIHNDEHLYKCTNSGESFINLSSFKMHMRNHSGDKTRRALGRAHTSAT